MHAMTVVPGPKGTAGVEEVPGPDALDRHPGDIKVVVDLIA
jgi:hypothetical protein